MNRKSLLIFKYRLFYCSASLNLVINQGTLRGLRAILSLLFGEEQSNTGLAKGLFLLTLVIKDRDVYGILL